MTRRAQVWWAFVTVTSLSVGGVLVTTSDWADLAKWSASLGVGGVLGAFMFLFYRRDMKDRIANQQQQTDLLMDVVKENTTAITTLTTEIRLRGGWLAERYAPRSERSHG